MPPSVGHKSASAAIAAFRSGVRRELQAHVNSVRRRMTTERLSGAGPASLATRSGQLRRSLNGTTADHGATMSAQNWIGGGGNPGTWVHEKGATITPRSAKNLAIPLAAARTGAGVPKVSGPRAWPKPLKLIVTKSGKKLLIEPKLSQRTVQATDFSGETFPLTIFKRKRVRKTYQAILPGGKRMSVREEDPVKALFVLKPAVTVPSRLGFLQTFGEEAQSTFRRIGAIKVNLSV